ncbi:MAG TPA: ATP-binding protein [Granulicella sp.]|nr:ATP-binding protein [Granulicella sp.]
MIVEHDRHILYVDDTAEQRYAMRPILEGAGFHVLEAGSGAEAFRQLYPAATEGPRPEVLAAILDVKLPDISGYDLCRSIKGNPTTSSLPILQIAGSRADPGLRAAGLSGGADAYVAQPVHPAELLALVEALIRSRDSEKTLRFQAEVSARLIASIDYQQTLRTIEQVFVPYFADGCTLYLRPNRIPAAGTRVGDVQVAGTMWRIRGANSLHRYSRDRAQQEHLLPGDVTAVPEHLMADAMRVSSTAESCLVGSSAIMVPLKLERRRLGALVFELYGDRRRYTPSDVVLAEDLADRSSLALQNAILYRAQQKAQSALVQSEKLAAAGRLSAAIAHEINNPLESITNLIYLIDTTPDISPAVKSYTQEALSEVSRLAHIARQSLGFYRELTGPAWFDLNESVDAALAIYQKRFDAKRIRIERNLGEALSLQAVKGEIRQVISNLLVNAFEAMSEDGMLHLETAATDPDHIVLRVIDNGSGIAAEAIDHIFDPFFTTRDGTGTGLGLWVSDSIVAKHGGSIEVSSNTEAPNQGTKFEVTLPRTPAAGRFQ